MLHVNTFMEYIDVQSLSQIDLQIEKPIVVDTIGEKLFIVLSEAEKILQTLRESIGGYRVKMRRNTSYKFFKDF